MAPPRPHDVPLLRRRLRRAGEPGRTGGATRRGRPEHPSNFGRLCSKGSALGETLGLGTRLLHPEVGGRARAGTPRSTTSPRCRASARRTGRRHRLLPLGPAPDRGLLRRQQARQGLHRHAARRYELAAVRPPGRRPPPRIRRRCRAAVLRRPRTRRPRRARRLQRGVVPPDPLPAHPARARRGVRVVVIDPRRTATCEGADLHLALSPGTDAALWNGLLAWLAAHGRLDWRFIGDHTEGFGAALAEARSEAARSPRSPSRLGSTARISRRSTRGGATPSASSAATARASTSRRRAPTRSTRS